MTTRTEPGETRHHPTILGVSPVFGLAIILGALFAVSLLAGCASPVVLEVAKGTIVVDGIGTVTGEGVRYARGVLRHGESVATWSGPVFGWPEPLAPNSPPTAPATGAGSGPPSGDNPPGGGTGGP